VGLAAVVVDGIAHGLAIDGEAFIDASKLRIPALQGLVEFGGINPNQDIAQDGFAGHRIDVVAVAASEAGARPGT